MTQDMTETGKPTVGEPGSEPEDAGGQAPPKQDPGGLELRGRPRPVVRFKRWLIAAATGVSTIALVSVAWVALAPSGLRIGAVPEEQRPAAQASPEVLAAAPATYGDVPRLGPPLPGDLGRPILEQQRADAQQTAAPVAPVPPIPPIDPAIAAAERARAIAEAEAERRRAAAEAARASSVIVRLAGDGSVSAVAAPAPVAADAPFIADAPAAPRMINGRTYATGDENERRLRPAPSPWTLSAGTVISASLITGLNSDVPGIVLAQVTEPVRDTATGRTILIPQGSRLIGNYESVVAFGQRRALVAWQRIVLPNGSSVQLGDMPAADVTGYSGLQDSVDFHTWRLLRGIGLSTLFGVGTELTLGETESDLVQALRESTQQNVARAGDQITRRNLDIQPTIRVRQGFPVRAIVNRDLILEPWRG